MFSTRVLHVVGLLVFGMAQATFLDTNLVGRNVAKIDPRRNMDVRAALIGNADTSSTTKNPSTTQTPARTSLSTVIAETLTTSQTPSSTNSQAAETPMLISSNPPAQSTTTSLSVAPDTATSLPDSSTNGTPTSLEIISSVASVSITIITIVSTATNSDGSLTIISTQSTSIPTASLSSDSSKGSSGMSTRTRNTVVGVVVGIGGAIVLIGLAFVAFRIWGRKRTHEEADGLMGYSSGYGNMEGKSETGANLGGSLVGRTPFKSTLESYHAPCSQVNTASNF